MLLSFRSILGGVCVYFFLSAFLISCEQKRHTFSFEERKTIDSILRQYQTEEELVRIQQQWEVDGNQLGSVSALRELGKLQRNESRFDAALETHSKGLRQAEALEDTLEIVQALNNIGTNYRRLGVLDVATEYHYNAWKMSEESSDTSFVAMKNRVVSLNGLGNIYMTLGNYERADSALRMALRGEYTLKSTIGQAINYANLGSIFEDQGQIDSAWVYYRRSMELNRKAKNELGISLCYTYFGSLFEREKNFEKASEAYHAAYELMKASKDEWHALHTLIAMAKICYQTSDIAQAEEYLQEALVTAEKIKSIEHLSEIYLLHYQIYKRQGDFNKALQCHERATLYADSIVDIKKMNQIQNTSLSIERSRQMQKMHKAEQEYQEERSIRNISFTISFMVILLLLSLISSMYYISRTRARNHRMLRKMNSVRETFFTNITHEFRTPLTLILGMSKDLQKAEGVGREVVHMGQVIERQGNSLLQLINQLLDISKVKSSVGDPHWRSGNIITYLEMVVDGYREHAHRNSIDLQFVAEENIEMDFVPDYANKLMNNLLSNAFKFTPKYGKINISAKKEGECLVLRIADTGIGIPEECIEHLFEPFFQVETEVQNIGTGVGLALVKQIVDAVGGTIAVESIEGKGTTFIITLPIRHGTERHAALAEEERHNTPLLPKGEEDIEDDAYQEEDERVRVLIVEDNSDVATYIGSRFGDRYAVSYAPNGRVGLEKAVDVIPDIIITDLMMPEMNGIDLCRQIRSNDLVNHIPIVVISAKVNEKDRIQALEVGADAFLQKPFNEEELRIRVEKLLEQRRLLREKYTPSLEDKEEGAELFPEPADRDFLTRMVTCIYMLMESGQLDIPTLAKRLCVSSRQLHRKVTALTGETPNTYVMQVRMRRAKQLLDRHPELTVADVALKCGFDEPSNFTRNFRKTYGISPKSYNRNEE